MIGNILGSISPHWEELQSGSIALADFSSDNITTVVTRVGSLDAEEVKVMINNLEERTRERTHEHMRAKMITLRITLQIYRLFATKKITVLSGLRGCRE